MTEVRTMTGTVKALDALTHLTKLIEEARNIYVAAEKANVRIELGHYRRLNSGNACIETLTSALTASASEPEPVASSAIVNIATEIDAEWRRKGGLNCTEVCAIVRSAALAKPVPTPDGAVKAIIPENWPEVLRSRAGAAHLNDTEGTVDLLQRTADYIERSAALSHPADGWRKLEGLTFAVQHNPNCPNPWLVRLPGKAGSIDMKYYGDPLSLAKSETGDILGFGKTLDEAASKALATAPAAKLEGE